MKLTKKLSSRRGTTLVEILLVVALMAIMLGVAMPNLLSESQAIKLATMDGYARSVAVAVQSKLYGIKNAGTSVDSSYANLNSAAFEKTIVGEDGKDKTVKCVSNFGENAEAGKRYLSGAMTDIDLLKNGKILVVYDPETADVLEVYYSEKDFDVDRLFPSPRESFLSDNFIGLYRGEGAPLPERNIGLPSFTATWGDDEEKYLQLQMTSRPEPELMSKHLGLEVYALLPTNDPKDPSDPLLIYTEGIIESDYKTNNISENDYSRASSTIASETYNPLTLNEIASNDNTMRFAIDSMVIQRAAYGDIKVTKRLYRQNYPNNVSMAEPVLYPRESLENWLDPEFNPYISFGIDAGYKVSDTLQQMLGNSNTKVTDYVKVDGDLKLKVRLYVLKEDSDGNLITEPVGENGCYRYVQDDKYEPFEITSPNSSPYFYSFSDISNEIALASVRDLQNLKYVFTTENKVTQARLYHDINIQDFYDKLVSVRYALLGKDDGVNPAVDFKNPSWPGYANVDNLAVDQIEEADGETLGGSAGFTITGEKDGGCYAIINVQTVSDTWGMGGFIKYAKNIHFENLDIVNPRSYKMNFNTGFIKTDEEGNITGIDRIDWDSGVSGVLCGIAENCTFTNVHCYNDNTQIFKAEGNDAVEYTDKSEWSNAPMSVRIVADSVVGGLVGLAIGQYDTTTFENCGVSVRITTHYNRRTTQCLYAGGLVGIAMGNVSIENSYAACQLSGYYSGGLVGATAKGLFNCGIYNYDGSKIEARYENVKGTLKIENSFSAGRIQRQTRVGGGLIAQVADSTLVDVNNCYSATTWEILPPIAYGTFKGDNKNYYLVEKEIAVPITLNTEAHFNCTGDVFSLKGGDKSGKAITSTDLNKEFNGTTWSNSTRTLEWRHVGTSDPTYCLATDDETGTGTKSTVYPFPMPNGNTQFWGDWNKEPATDITGGFEAKFEGFYCAYYQFNGNNGRTADTALIVPNKFEFTNDNHPTLNGKIINNNIESAEDIWWGGYYDYWGGSVNYTTGVAGMTDVTVSGTNVTFTGAAYYNKSYDPTKGYVDVDVIGTVEGKSSYYLNWDYYGWYFTENTGISKEYLVQSAENENMLSATLNGKTITVTEDEFKEVIGYNSFTFNTNSANLVYQDGCFQVKVVGV